MPSPTNPTRFVLLTLLFVLAWNFTSSLGGWGWPTAAFIALIMTSVYTWPLHSGYQVRLEML